MSDNIDPVYEWTRNLFPVDLPIMPIMTLGQLQELTNRIWRTNGLDGPPRIKGGIGDSQAETDGLTIYMPLRARNMVILLHEIAHVIMIRNGFGIEHHDEFYKTVIRLYSEHLGIDPEIEYPEVSL